MKGIFGSGVVRSLFQPLASVAAVSTLVCIYEDLLADGSLPATLPSLIMPTAPFDLTSFALSLLLVFRTNTSYDRWLETCTVWSGLANRSRDTMRQLVSHLGDSTGAISPLAAAMCRWVVAYTRSLKAELQEGNDLGAELAGVLTEGELAELLAARHRPSFALSVLTELGAAAPLRESHRIRLDENLTWFEDAVGTCERILQTPIPLSYTRHTSRFMVIWLSALPLGLYSSCGFATVPLTMTIAFLLLGIDEIGVQIEEPFSILPLDDLCDEIEGDVYGVLQEAVATKRTAAAAAASALGVGGDGASSPLPMAGRIGGGMGLGLGPPQPQPQWAESSDFRRDMEDSLKEKRAAAIREKRAAAARTAP
jgi:predicted membrane chloride channel (bestrophin family)